jgi:hypothetical protein
MQIHDSCSLKPWLSIYCDQELLSHAVVFYHVFIKYVAFILKDVVLKYIARKSSTMRKPLTEAGNDDNSMLNYAY